MTTQHDSGHRTFRFAVNVTPRPGILDPQGRAVEQSLPHLDVHGVTGVRVGRRVELSVSAADEASARRTVERLASELLSNPLIEAFAIERLAEARVTDDAAAGDRPEPPAAATPEGRSA